jgi:hypothetical protein
MSPFSRRRVADISGDSRRHPRHSPSSYGKPRRELGEPRLVMQQSKCSGKGTQGFDIDGIRGQGRYEHGPHRIEVMAVRAWSAIADTIIESGALLRVVLELGLSEWIVRGRT